MAHEEKTPLLYKDGRPSLYVGDLVRLKNRLRIIARKIVREHPLSYGFTIFGEMAPGQGYPVGHQGFAENFHVAGVESPSSEDDGGAWATPSWEEP